MGKCVWNCVWFVIWFNVVFMLVCVVIGYVCGMMGVQPGQNLGVAKTEGGMLFFNALWVGGLLAAFCSWSASPSLPRPRRSTS